MNSDRSDWANKNQANLYSKKQRKNRLFIAFLALTLIISGLIALGAGSYITDPADLIKAIFGQAEDPKINIIIQNNRLPRILTAIVAGAGLGLVGCILQAILQNPLASASTLGVSQGAGFGAALAIIVFDLSSRAIWAIPLFAFVGSVSVAILILGLSRIRSISPETIVLAGVAISSMFTGATALIQYFADEVQLAGLIYWTFGDLGSSLWPDIHRMLALVSLFGLYCFLHRWDYNALLTGRETAISLGIQVQSLTMINMVFCCLTASFIVSHVGLISFVGLVAPHLVRMVVGNNHVYLIPGALLAGAVILLLSDVLARTIIAPVILPIGAITSFLGAPLFLFLLFKERSYP